MPWALLRKGCRLSHVLNPSASSISALLIFPFSRPCWSTALIFSFSWLTVFISSSRRSHACVYRQEWSAAESSGATVGSERNRSKRNESRRGFSLVPYQVPGRHNVLKIEKAELKNGWIRNHPSRPPGVNHTRGIASPFGPLTLFPAFDISQLLVELTICPSFSSIPAIHE